MSSIDYLKFLLKKEEKTDEERKEDMDLEEAYLTQAGVIPRQRTIDPKQYDKLTEGQKMQFFNPHKTYDSDDKYKAIDKLKSLLNKDAMSKLSRFNPNKIIHTKRDAKIGRKFPKDLKGTKTDVPTYNTSSGQREATLLGNTRIPVQQEKKIDRFNERYNVERPSKVPYKKRVRDWHKDTQKPTSFKENILQPKKPDKHDRDFEDKIERRDTKPYSFDHDVHTEFKTNPFGRRETKEAKIDMLREHQQDREQEKQRKINEGTDYNHRKYGHWNKILTSDPSTGKLRRTVDNKKLMEQAKDKENKREAKRWKEEDPDRVYVNQSAINKLKALLNKTQIGYKHTCRTCGADVESELVDRTDLEGRKKIKNRFHQCKNCKKQDNVKRKKDLDTVSHYFDLTNDPEYQRQREEFIERRSRGENVGNFKFKKPRNKSIDKLKALLAKEGETNSGEKSHIEDKERQEKETKTPENLLTWSRVKREFDDETHEDPY